MSQEIFKFRLYVAGDTHNSLQALTNLTHFCRTYLAERYEIEVVDVFIDPYKSLEDSIFMTPTLIKLSPSPILKIVGTLSQTQVLQQVLALEVLTL